MGILFLKSNVSDWEFNTPISITQEGTYPTIQFSKKEVELKGSAVTDTLKVFSNCTWAVDGGSYDWLTITEKENILILSALVNETDQYRTATINVSHTGNTNITNSFVVKQAPASIIASSESIKLENDATTITLTIDSEASWTASTVSSWMEISHTFGNAGTTELLINVSANTTIYDRTGYIILTIGGIDRIQIPVIQKGYYIEIESNDIVCESSGGTYELSIISNTDWDVVNIPEWISLDQTSGNGTKTINLSIKDNPSTQSRSAVIHIGQSGLSLDKEIKIQQKGRLFDIATTILNYDDKESTKEVHIETDGIWTASTNEDWIILKPSVASEDSILTIGVKENVNEDERTGIVSVTMSDKTININVVQKGKYFTVDNSLLTFTSKGGYIVLSITSSENWTASIEDNPQWIKLSKTNGSGNLEITVTAEDNPSVNIRIATIIIETTHFQPIRVVVKQEARKLSVDTSEILFYPKGGTSDLVTITTDGKYQIDCSESWLIINEYISSFTVTASQYSEKKAPRVGTITISLTDLKEGASSLKLNVTQLNEGGTFLLNGYGEDENWDYSKPVTTNLSISGFESEKNWDNTSNSRIKVSVKSIKTEKNKNRE